MRSSAASSGRMTPWPRTDRIAEDLGVTIDIRTVPSYVEAEAAIADGSADLYLNIDWDIAFAESKGMAATISYATDY